MADFSSVAFVLEDRTQRHHFAMAAEFFCQILKKIGPLERAENNSFSQLITRLCQLFISYA
jgi:hypothetical protein